MDNISIKKASLFYLFGTLFNKGIGFITTPIFTRILSISDYGTITTYTSWFSMLSVVFSLALYMGIRAAFLDYSDKIEDFCATITTFNLIYGATVSSACIIFVNIFGINVDNRMVICCLVQSVMGAIIENYLMYLMMKYKYKLRTAFMILPNLISTIMSIVLILFVFERKQYFVRICVSVIVYVVFGGIAVILIYKKSKVYNKEYLVYGLKISVPLILHGIALGILSQSDRTMITAMRGEEETARYGLVYNYSMIATVLTTAFDGVWIPWFVKKMKANLYDEINDISRSYVRFMTAALSGVVLVGPEVVRILAPKGYWESIVIIPALVLSNYIIFLYTLFVNIEHYYKKTVFISLNTCVAAISNIILNVLFIKWFGYMGAAYTTLISYVISLLLHIIYSKRLNKKLLPIKAFAIPSLCVLCCVFSFYFFIENICIRWIIAVIVVVVTIISEKNKILKFLRKE